MFKPTKFIKHLLFAALPLSLILTFATASLIQAQGKVPRYERADCPIDVPNDASIECGIFTTFEDYDNPNGNTIRTSVIIIHSTNPDPAPDPILLTEGGPGYSSLGSVWYLARSEFVNDRDVVILEQRGNVYAQPNLVCDLSTAWGEAAGAPCLERFKDEGIDLTQYKTANIVADMNALRRVLNYKTWNLYGGSYSTRLMQLTMHLYPDGIRSVILQSVSSLTETRYEHDPEHAMRALQVMLDDCAADPACAAAYPDLETQLYTAVRNLNADPVSFDFIDSETGEPYSLVVDGVRFLDWMVTDAFYGPAWPPHKTAYLPLLIDQVAQGNTELLFPWLEDQIHGRYMDSSSAWAWGLYFAVNCQDDASAVTADMMARQTAVYPQLDGYIRAATELEVCKAWNLPASPPLLTEPLTSDIPTLILAGTYDPITPPSWGQAVAANLNHSYYYEFPSAGHNVTNDNPCAESIKLAFLKDPMIAPDSSCISDVPGPSFILPDDITIAPGFYNSSNEIDLGDPNRGNPLLEFLAGGSLILFLLVIGYLLVAGVVRLVRRDNYPAAPYWTTRITSYIAGLTAVTGWTLMFLISDVNSNNSQTDWLLLYFGLPLNYPPTLATAILVPVFIILTICLVVLTALAWKRHAKPVWKCMFFTLVTVAAVSFAGLMMHWDLHSLLF